jgi:hypothetical protein
MTLLSSSVAQSRQPHAGRGAAPERPAEQRELPEDLTLLMIEALSRAMAARDGRTHEHAQRTTSASSVSPIACSTSPARSPKPNTSTSSSTRPSAPTSCRPSHSPVRSQ